MDAIAIANVEIGHLITMWLDGKKRLEVAKDAERTMRDEIVRRVFPDAKKGTNRVLGPNGQALKYVKKVDAVLSKPETFEGDNVDLVSHIGKLFFAAASNEGQFICERLFKYKVEVSATEFNKLKADAAQFPKIKQLLDIVTPFIMEKDGAPTLELEEKAKGRK